LPAWRKQNLRRKTFRRKLPPALPIIPEAPAVNLNPVTPLAVTDKPALNRAPIISAPKPKLTQQSQSQRARIKAPLTVPVIKPDSSNNRKIIAVIKTPKNKKSKVASINSLRDAWPRKKRVRVHPRRARQMSRLKRQRYARSRLLARRKPQQPKTKSPVLTKPGLTKPGLTKSAWDHAPSSPTAPTKRDLGQPHKNAQSGLLAAQLALAQHYHTSEGVSVSNIKALFWFYKAAHQGVAEAQLNLGMIYYLGDGVPKNLAKAYHWIKLAAQQNDQRAVII